MLDTGPSKSQRAYRLHELAVVKRSFRAEVLARLRAPLERCMCHPSDTASRVGGAF